MRNDFAVFIITHGRPDKQLTYNVLQSIGYSGRLYFVLDDTDDTIQQYIDTFGVDRLLIFNKNYYINSDKYDNGTNTGIYACAIYARRAVEDIAKALNLKYFCLMDDDITDICVRYKMGDKILRRKITCIDNLFEVYLDLLENENFSCLGFSTPMFYFTDAHFVSDVRNVPFQTFIRKTSYDVRWPCFYGEDEISGYISNTTGNIWTTLPFIMSTISPLATGAMLETYSTYNSYMRCIVEFRYRPSDFIIDVCSRGAAKGTYKLYKKNKDWFPKIISDKYKK